MKDKVYKLNVIQYVLDNFFIGVSIIWGILLVVMIFVYPFAYLNLSFISFVAVLLLIVSIVLVSIYGLFIQSTTTLRINDDSVFYKDNYSKKEIVFNIKNLLKITPRTIVLGLKDTFSMDIPDLSLKDVIKDSVNNEIAGSVAGAVGEMVVFDKSKTGKSMRRAIINKYGGGYHESWYGRYWLEISTKDGINVIPLDNFDSKTRIAIANDLRSKLSNN